MWLKRGTLQNCYYEKSRHLLCQADIKIQPSIEKVESSIFISQLKEPTWEFEISVWTLKYFGSAIYNIALAGKQTFSKFSFCIFQQLQQSGWTAVIIFSLRQNLNMLQHTWTEIKLNSTWVYLESKGAMRTPSIRASKWAPTSYVCALASTTL